MAILKESSVDDTDAHILTACLRLLFPDCKIDIQEESYATILREMKQ